jgi:hypothetical protein
VGYGAADTPKVGYLDTHKVGQGQGLSRTRWVKTEAQPDTHKVGQGQGPSRTGWVKTKAQHVTHKVGQRCLTRPGWVKAGAPLYTHKVGQSRGLSRTRWVKTTAQPDTHRVGQGKGPTLHAQGGSINVAPYAVRGERFESVSLLCCDSCSAVCANKRKPNV